MKKFEEDKAKWRKRRGGGGKEKREKKQQPAQAKRADALESKWDRRGVYFSSGTI